MKNTLTWLHLSDLHLTCKKSDKDWTTQSINQDIVISSLLNDIKKLLIDKEITPDLIFITGDLVKGGKSDEYLVATEFCDQLLTITSLSKQQLFIVPGNHDVDRTQIADLHTKTWYPFKTQDDVSDILSDPDLSLVLLKKLKGFYEFHASYFEHNDTFEHYPNPQIEIYKT